MGQVIDIKKRESGFVKYLHRTGWEKGFKIKGKWNGYYENIGILPNTDITCYSKGNFNMGLREGSWEITCIDHNRNNFTQVHTGRYLNGKRHGDGLTGAGSPVPPAGVAPAVAEAAAAAAAAGVFAFVVNHASISA